MYIKCAADGRLDVNVALNRTSYVSSTYLAYSSSAGNDGDKSNCDADAAYNSVMHTDSELNPWYAVDLGVPLQVAGVKLTNRADELGED